jgi:N-acyl-D-aspartate/D-glutamate deacylase
MILIKSAQILDGSGKPPFRADVLIKDDKISALGTFSARKADQIIDGLGCYLAPGFIDVNTDSDHYLSLFTYPSQSDFLLQGVTTIIGGHCGASLAPLIYGTLESIRKWTDISRINVDWHTAAEFFKVLNRRPLGVNFGTLVGHTTIRRALIGDDLRDLTISELDVFVHIVEQALKEGALGLSSGLGYAHARRTPYQEIKTLVQVAARYGGVYATHLRDERNGLLASVSETIKVGRETGAKILISHLRPIIGFENDFETALDILDAANEQLDIHFDSYPFDTSLIPIYTLLPFWAQNGGLEVMLENIRSEHVKERILKELPPLPEDALRISQAPGTEYLAGKTLGEYARNYDLPLSQALLQLMEVTRLRASVLYKNINGELAIKALMRDPALVASNGASVSPEDRILKHERFVGTFPKFLEIVSSRKIMPLELAIKKLTSVPAKKFGFKNRGLVKEGYFADLVLLRENKPYCVFVNGQPAVKEGKLEPFSYGKILKRSL